MNDNGNNNLNNIEVLDIDTPVTNNDLKNQFIKPVESVPVPPRISEIGGIPSSDWQNNSQKHKKFNFKILWIILIIVLIVLFGLGLYYFLVYAKNTTSMGSKIATIELELGSELSDNIDDYVDGLSDCKIDLSSVDISKIGEYDYKINCSDKSYTAKAKVVDTTAPQVSLKIFNAKNNETIEATNFIMNSYDLSKTTVSFEDKNKALNDIKNNGIYIERINVVDEYNNKNSKDAILVVSNVVAEKYLSASKNDTTNYNASLKVNDKIGFNSVDYFVNAIRIYDYIFNSQEDYDKAKAEYDSSKMIENHSGVASFDDEYYKIKIVKLLDSSELNKLNGLFPSTFEEVRTLYGSKGYQCSLEMS